MAGDKLDLPADLMPFKAAGEPWGVAVDDSNAGNFEGKGLIGLPDDLKDNATSENSIPLSPQWLYAKPSDCKPGLSASSTDMRSQNSLPHGSSTESIQKDGWRLDGSQDKKDWRRTASDVEGSRRWREEERETGLLGRRERRKEGDKENEYRKSERRAENISVRETSDLRSMASDRWQEVGNRNLGHENRRDNKWSSRWGPEEKAKDSRPEKKFDADKEDTHNEKQSSVGSNCAPSEFDGRDKWRPRHRQEAQAGASTIYRAAPGFGLDKGRTDGTNAGFALGRGRSNLIRSLPIGCSPSAGPVGVVPVNNNEAMPGMSVISAGTFRYPRGKLLDIYRKQKIFSSFDTVPEGLEEVPPLTQSNLLEPLAFVAPDSDEEALLQDVWKGKITSSESSSKLYRENMLQANDIETGNIDMMVMGSKPDMNVTEEISESFAKSGSCDSSQKNDGDSCIEEHDRKNDTFTAKVPFSDLKVDVCQIRESCSYSSNSNHVVYEAGGVGVRGLTSQFSSKLEDNESAVSFDMHAKLPDDLNNRLDSPFFKDTMNMNELYEENICEMKLDKGIPAEELNLFYQDPQGEIQGPFLGVDIISWFDQGFFGIDLPVCVSDAPEGTPFQELGELMPHLKHRTQPVSVFDRGDKPDPLVAIGHDLEGDAVISDIAASNAVNEWQWTQSEKDTILLQNVRSNTLCHGDLIDPHDDGFPHLKSESSSGIASSGKQSFRELAEPDEEEVLYSGRAASNSRSLLPHDRGLGLNLHHSRTSEMGESGLPNRRVPADNDLHPRGMRWSGLEGAHSKHQFSPILSGFGDRGNLMYPEFGRDTSILGQQQDFIGAIADSPAIHDPWVNVHGRNRVQSPNVFQDAMDAHELSRPEQESSRLILEDHLLSQRLQKQHFRQQNVSSPRRQLHLSESLLDQLQGPHHQQSVNPPVRKLEHVLELQFQQQQLLQLQHQHRQLQQQQQQQQLLHQQRQLQQQQQQQQQQQLHHRSIQLLQQHQHQLQQQPPSQSHVQRLLFEQLLQQQMQEPSIGPPQVDPLRGNSVLDEVLFRERMLHELQQQPLHPLRHYDSSLERLIQAKFGHGLHMQPDEMIEVLSHPKHRRTHLDKELFLNSQQEQLQARRFPGGSRQLPGIEEERHVGGIWSVDDSGQLVIASAGQHRPHAAVTNRLDLFQRQQRQPPFEQLNHIDRTLSLHENIHHGLYEPGSRSFERSLPSPVAAHGLNMELVSRLQGLDLQDHLGHVQSSVQMGQLPPNVRSHHRQIPNQLNSSHMDMVDTFWPEADGRLPNSLVESQFHHLHLEAERQRRDLKMNLGPEEPNTWTAVGNVEDSKHAMDILRENLNVHSLQSLKMVETPGLSHETRESAWPFSGPASDRSFNHVSVQSCLENSSPEDTYGSKMGQVLQEQLVSVGAAGRADGFESGERLPFQCSSGVMMEDEQFLASGNDTKYTLFADSVKAGGLSEDVMDFVEGKKGKTSTAHGSKVGNMELYNFEIGVENSHSEELIKDRLPGFILPKGSENSLVVNHSQGSHVLSSQEALVELATVPTMRAKDNNLSSSDGRRDPGGCVAFQPPEIPAPARDIKFRRISDVDTLEASFVDMLKSTRKPMPEADSTTAGLESDLGSKINKKKGKKGRQIDPSLLGFKVHSNRILMGEIQRPNE